MATYYRAEHIGSDLRPQYLPAQQDDSIDMQNASKVNATTATSPVLLVRHKPSYVGHLPDMLGALLRDPGQDPVECRDRSRMRTRVSVRIRGLKIGL